MIISAARRNLCIKIFLIFFELLFMKMKMEINQTTTVITTIAIILIIIIIIVMVVSVVRRIMTATYINMF